MPGVYVRHDDEPVDKLLRVLKKQVERAGTMLDLKKKTHYVKPSVAKILKSRKARARVRKDKAKEERR